MKKMLDILMSKINFSVINVTPFLLERIIQTTSRSFCFVCFLVEDKLNILPENLISE